MNIIVCVKEVPNPCFPVEIDTANNTVNDKEWNYVINPCDEAAVEEAIRLKEKFGGEVTVITLGTARAEEILRKCLAMGADKAIRLYDDNMPGWDAYTTASLLAGAIGQLPYDIIFCGLQSTDRGGGEVGNMIAEILNLPVVTAAVKVEISGDGKSATVSRRLERGAREIKRCPLPAVFTADLMLNEPRYPTLPGIKKALRQNIEKLNIASFTKGAKVPETIEQLTRVTGIFKPPPKKVFIPTGTVSPMDRIRLLTQGGPAKKSSSSLLEGSPDEIAKKAVDFLFERRFLP